MNFYHFHKEERRDFFQHGLNLPQGMQKGNFLMLLILGLNTINMGNTFCTNSYENIPMWIGAAVAGVAAATAGDDSIPRCKR